jgi:DNA-binding NtrC family response regulator
MSDDEELIKQGHAQRIAGEQAEREAIINALRNRSVRHSRITEITGFSRETIRLIRKEAGIPPDERYIRTPRQD